MECFVLKPCCVRENVMYGDMLLRTSLSSIFEGVQKSAIGLFGFRSGIIFATFHVLGMLFVVSDVLKMSVRALMACGPRCFRCKYDMPSGPVEDLFLVLRMACSVMFVVKGVSMFVCSFMLCSFLSVTLSSNLFGSLHMLE